MELHLDQGSFHVRTENLPSPLAVVPGRKDGMIKVDCEMVEK